MGGFAHSIFNPINDIKNIAEGAKNLVINPAKQFHKYILPAAESALPAAASVGMTVLSAGALLPEAIALSAGTYGTQVATKGLGNLTSGGVPSIGDWGAGIAAAGGVGAISALGAPAAGLTTATSGVGSIGTGTSAFMSGLGTIGSDITGGISSLGSGIAGGISSIGSDIAGGVSSLGSLVGLGGTAAATTAGATAAGGVAAAAAPSLLSTVGGYLLSAAPYIVLGGLSLYSSAKQAAAEKAAMQQMQNEINQGQQQQACSSVLNLSPNDMVAIQWSQLVPQLSPSCISQLQSALPNKITDIDVAEAIYYTAIGQIASADEQALFKLLPSSLVSAGQSLYTSCMAGQSPHQVASSQTAAQQFVNCLNGVSSATSTTGTTSTTCSPGQVYLNGSCVNSNPMSDSPSISTGITGTTGTTGTLTTPLGQPPTTSGVTGYYYGGQSPLTTGTTGTLTTPLGQSPTTSGVSGYYPIGQSPTTSGVSGFYPTAVEQYPVYNTSSVEPSGFYTTPTSSTVSTTTTNNGNESGSNVSSFKTNYSGIDWLVKQTENAFNNILQPLSAI